MITIIVSIVVIINNDGNMDNDNVPYDNSIVNVIIVFSRDVISC